MDLHGHDHTQHHEHSSRGWQDFRGPELPAGTTAPMDHIGRLRAERARGQRGETNKTIRPSTLQKFCKKFNGSGDPYDHIAQYRHLYLLKELLMFIPWFKPSD